MPSIRCSQLYHSDATRRCLHSVLTVTMNAADRALASAQRLGDFAQHERRVADRREIEEPDAVGVVRRHFGRDLQRQARLAVPPMPSKVSRRAVCKPFVTSASSRSRPMNDVVWLRQVVRDVLDKQQALAAAHDERGLRARRRFRRSRCFDPGIRGPRTTRAARRCPSASSARGIPPAG